MVSDFCDWLILSRCVCVRCFKTSAEFACFWKPRQVFPPRALSDLVDLEDLYFDVLLCDVNFSRFSSQVFLPSYWNMTSLDSQGEIVPTKLPNPEETQIWEGENESVRSRQHLVLPLLLVISSFIRQARIGCYGNGLIDVKEKPQILKRLWWRRSRVIRNSGKHKKNHKMNVLVLNP